MAARQPSLNDLRFRINRESIMVNGVVPGGNLHAQVIMQKNRTEGVEHGKRVKPGSCQ
jgi:hypothetical protein